MKLNSAFFLPILIALGLFPHLLHAQPKLSTDEAVVRKLVAEVWPTAYRTQSIKTLDSLLADDVTIIDPQGKILRKRESLEMLVQPWPITDFVYTGQHFWTDGRTALAVGVGSGMRAPAGGQPYRFRDATTAVLRKEKTGWRVIALQISAAQQVP